MLFGFSMEHEKDTIYIGETNNLGNRLKQHQREKDFWTTAYVFTTVSESSQLNESIVQYMENDLLYRAKDAKELHNLHLDNVQSRNTTSLSEADKILANGFLEKMLLSYPVLGLRAFEKLKPIEEDTKIYDLAGSSTENIQARGYESTNGFTVLRGARARSQATLQESMPKSALESRELLQNQGLLTRQGDNLVLKKNHEFNSPSLAAAVFLGRSPRGLKEWEDQATGKTLKDMQGE